MSFTDEEDDLLAPRRPARLPAGADDLAATISLTAILLIVGGVLSFGVLLQQTGIAGCSEDPAACDHELLAAATWMTPVATLAVAGLSIVALVRRATTRRRTWWVPALGILITFTVFALSCLFVSSALPDINR